MIVAKSCCFTFQRISALATNCQGSLKLVYDSSRQMSYFHIHPAKPSFHSSAGSLCDHPIHIYSSFVFPGTKMLRQKCHYAFVLIRSWWMGKKVGDSTRSIHIQCADGVVIHAHIGRNLADVYVRSNWLEPDLWLGYPDREKIPSEGPKRSFRTNSSPVKLLDRPFKFSTKSTVYISYSSNYTGRGERIGPSNLPHGNNNHA
ncbi:hypothetical protein Tsp_10259 [Trichinella spiralis]|uniref:hypothetical protein n=1 Tax=Trichinella spiralis TaxID=6334 RepID=UPI0001EFDFC0|nr:hypothetical protein Tsp_10259 [Trichinella spiralis]